MCIVCREYEKKIEKLDRHLDAVRDAPGAYCVLPRAEVQELRDFIEAKKQEYIGVNVEASGW